jgi:hypothetical protein
VARINIEECWWSDPRRTKLLLKIGFAADAAAVNMWRAAQEFWGKGRGLIPKHVYDKIEYAQELIDSGLADVRESFVYVRGCSEYLEWHAEKREQASAAGKKSAEVRRKKAGTAQPQGGKGYKKTEQEPNDIRTVVNGTEPSGSRSLSGSDSGLGSAVVANPPAKPAVPVNVVLNSEIWKAYSDAYFLRYGTEPVRNARVNAQVKQIGQALGSEAPDVVRFFVSHQNSYYVRSGHKIGLCLSDAETLRTQWATGRKITNREAQQADDGAALEAQLKRIRGET